MLGQLSDVWACHTCILQAHWTFVASVQVACKCSSYLWPLQAHLAGPVGGDRLVAGHVVAQRSHAGHAHVQLRAPKAAEGGRFIHMGAELA